MLNTPIIQVPKVPMTSIRLRAVLFYSVMLVAMFSRAQTLNVPANYAHIQDAINAAVDGDTVLVAPGTYFENLDFLGKDITVTSSGGAAVTILDGSRNSAPAATMSVETAKHGANPPPMVLNGFTIQNGGAEPSTVGTGGVFINSVTSVISNNILMHNHCAGIWEMVLSTGALIEDNEIDNTLDNGGDCPAGGGSAIVVTNTQTGCVSCTYTPTVVLGNVIQNNTQAGQEGPGAGGVTVQSRPVAISNNTFRNNASAELGGAIYIGARPSSGVSIVQNLIYENQSACGGAIASQGNGVYAGYIGNLLIASNTLVDNTISGQGCNGSNAPNAANANQIVFADYGSNLFTSIVVNNILAGNTTQPMVTCALKSATASGYNTPIIDHNVYLNSGGPVFDTNCTDPTGQYGNQNADPLFVNAAALNFQLQSASPAIDAGNTSELLPEMEVAPDHVTATDFAGNARVVDATGKGYAVIDVGAYEAAGTSDTQATTVHLAPTGLSGNPATTPSIYTASGGSSVDLAATVTSTVGGPTGCVGAVSFLEDGSSIGVQNVVSYTNVATQKGVFLAPGVHRFTAVYAGQSPCGPAVSVEILYIVSNYAPNLTLTASVNPVQVTQPVTFTVSLTSADPSQGGPIYLTDNNGTTTLATLSPSMTTYTTSTLSIGNHSILASYAGDATHGAASASLTESVVSGPIATQTVLSSSDNPSAPAEIVSFTAAVSSASGVPTGSVVFSEGSVSYATVPLNSGFAQFSLGTLSVGMHTLVATYVPAGLYTASAGSVVQTVGMVGSTTMLVVTPVKASYNYGSTITMSAGVSPSGNAPNIPTGTLTFFDNGTALSPIQMLTNGAAKLATTQLLPGTHMLTAQYGGDSVFMGSVSDPIVVVVNPEATTFALTINNPDVTIAHGGTAIVSLALNSVGTAGMGSSIGFAVSGAPDYSVITFSPASVTTGSGMNAVTLTIKTPDYPSPPFGASLTGVGVFAGALLLFARRRRAARLFLLAVSFAMVSLTGCGWGWGTQHFTVVVTATSGTSSRTATASLTSQ